MCKCCENSEKTITLNVEGMSCGHCKMAVEKSVSGLDGVSKVEVNLAAKSVTVNFNPDRVNEAAIKDTIVDQGYDII